ncbi:tRNA modification GTPase trmE [Mesorhizobium albiziae]|uniref:tRNA modification GTPase MnmE n=2 Tax=Neomesorhizobium albiziae TaxID=335020 RepID=A0A1I3Y4J6_9HYPH|nr:tRNA modification GTPase MnmE [Mesorhizobium albiziae]SFK26735.1 tRNA modification GTPase trmE [Mesorhizobium albiziae]
MTMTGSVPEPRFMRFGAISDADGNLLDNGLTVFFSGPTSFTGEDSCEFHLHGGRAVVAAVLEAVGAVPGFRHAEAGEFSRRAFLNGKIDLTGAEALSDLVSSETEAQRRFALTNAGGKQSELYAAWRRRIVHARAMIEAELDFSDQEDVPGSVSDQVWADMHKMIGEMETHIASYRRAEMIRDGFKVVILGAPNAGKSSLLNSLARREVAIVTDEAGTTRDLVEVTLDLDGMKVIVIDTAGIREAAGKVETIGIERALATAETADLVLEMHDLSASVRAELPMRGDAASITVGTKSDLMGGGTSAVEDFRISTKTGDGVASLLAEISRRAKQAIGDIGEAMPSRIRHIELLTRSASALRDAVQHQDNPLELRAEDLRRSSDSLGRIAGAVDVEDLLDSIFSTFCVGK